MRWLEKTDTVRFRIPWRKLLYALLLIIVLLPVVMYAGLWYVSYYPSVPNYRPIEQVVYLNEEPGACKDVAVDESIRATMPKGAFDKSTRNPDSSYQGWCEDYRQVYYRLPQGTTFFGLRYDWVANLERPVGRERLMNRAYMESIGFIYDGAKLPNENNPGDLPIGLTWHFEEGTGQKILDVGCAACHSSQLTYQGKALQIDGGSGGHALTSSSPSQFIAMSVASLFTSYINPFKFNRLADKVLKDVSPEDLRAARREMREAMWQTIKEAVVYAWYNRPSLYPTEGGYGRTDGLARIANTVFADNLDRKNYRTGDAPVNYPHLWDIWAFDWVQWMGSVKQAMARNLNESLGVRARLDLKDPQHMFTSSARVTDMHCTETVLQHLLPPTWPEDLFGKIDRDLSAEGEQLFKEVCQTCHGPFRFDVAAARASGLDDSQIAPAKPTDCQVCHGPWVGKPGQSMAAADTRHLNSRYADTTLPGAFRYEVQRDEVWQVAHIPLAYIGTDPTSALNFINNTYDLSALQDTVAGKAVTVIEGQPSDLRYIDDWEHVPGGDGLRFIGGEVRFNNYADMQIWDKVKREPTDKEAVDDLNGFGEYDRPKAWRAYRPRPLEAVWATAPYLHNGSVPTLYQLLSPADERDAVFYLGRKEYDPAKLGLRTEKFKGAFAYDTTITGNSNMGHEFDDGMCGNGVIGYQVKGRDGFCRRFTEREKLALLEYLKVHSDDPRIEPPSIAHCQRVTWPEAEQ